MKIEPILQDLRFAIRLLAKAPTLSLTVILTFGLGIGLTSTVFNITNGFVHKELPFDEADRLMVLNRTDPERDVRYGGVAEQDFLAWREEQSVFEGLAAYVRGELDLSPEEGRPERFDAGWVSPGIFEILRVQPILGRTFVVEDESPGSEPVMIIGHEIWQERFGGASGVVGRTVLVAGVSRTIIGVMPEGFGFPYIEKIWIPLVVYPEAIEQGNGWSFPVLARLAEGVSPSEAKTQITTIAQRLEQVYPESNIGIGVTVRSLKRALTPVGYYVGFYSLVAVAFGVLLIGCTNVANLLLARASTRRQEVAVKMALGAGRHRLITQFLSEVFVLALIGGAIGFGIGHIGIEWFVAQMDSVMVAAGDGEEMPSWMNFEHDYRVVLFVFAATVVASLMGGLYPAFQTSATDVGEAMKGESRSASSFRMGKFSGGLVITEVAVSCGLLILAGLMIKSVAKLSTAEWTYATENVFTAGINLPNASYPSAESEHQFYEELLPRLNAIPGVTSAALGSSLPPLGFGEAVVEVEGRTYQTEEDYPRTFFGHVTPGYFDVLERPVIRGRDFKNDDRREALPVAVVSESFARVHFAGEAIGRRVRLRYLQEDGSYPPWKTVVGIVPDIESMPSSPGFQSPVGFYSPMAQAGGRRSWWMILRTQGPPMAVTPDVRAAVASIDADVAMYRVLSMDAWILRMSWFYPVLGTLCIAFGLAALFLGTIGLYGVMSFAVTQRTREMGIRMALGAESGCLVGFIMRKGIIRLAIGIGMGFAFTMVIAGPLQYGLFEVNARDPIVFGVVILTLACAGLLANLLPARRVTKVDPVVALSSE